MIGLQVFDAGGGEIIDTNNRKFYFLAGKIRSVTNSIGNQYINIPPRYRNLDTVIALKLRDSYNFASIALGFCISSISSSGIELAWRTNKQGTYIPGTDLRAIEAYVYSLSEMPDSASGMGLATYNASGDVTFSSGSDSRMLQITSVYNNLNAMGAIDLGQRSQGIIISSSPREKPGAGVYPVYGVTYVYDNGNVSTEWVDTGGYGYSPGTWAFPQMCLAFVDLPEDAPYIA